MTIRRIRSAPSSVVSLRVSTEQSKRLKRRARLLGRTPSETGAMLLEEGLRRADFAFIDFRDSATGRQAYVLGSRLAVWQVVSVVRALRGRVDEAAVHLGWPVLKVRAAMNYAAAFPGEIEEALGDVPRDVEVIQRTLPQLEDVVVPPSPRRR